MKLKYLNFKAFELKQGGITVIGTNNRLVYQELMLGLRSLSSKVCLYDENYEKLEIEKKISVNTEIIYTRDVLTKYRKKISNYISDSFDERELVEINTKLNELATIVQNKLYLFDIPLEFERTNEVSQLLKLGKIKLLDCFLERIFDIIIMDIKLNKEFNIQKLLVYENINNFLSSEEFVELEYLVRELNMNILLIEFTEFNNKDYYQNADFYYIDQDFIDFRPL